jgi:hypothetical protein
MLSSFSNCFYLPNPLPEPLFSHHSSNPLRPGKFGSASFPSSWWSPFQYSFWWYIIIYIYILFLLHYS